MAQVNETGNQNDGSSGAGDGETRTLAEVIAELEEIKGHSRKWEDRAKENLAAKKALDEINAAKMTEDEKRAADAEAATAALAKAEARAEAAEAALRRAEIVAEFGLTTEDAAALSGVTDEVTLKALAERLAGRQGAGAPKPLSQGRHGTGDPAPTGNAALFAEAMSGLF